jgi:hypothetical protein
MLTLKKEDLMEGIHTLPLGQYHSGTMRVTQKLWRALQMRYLVVAPNVRSYQDFCEELRKVIHVHADGNKELISKMMSLVVYVSDDKMLRGLRDKALVIFVEDFMLHPKYEKIMQEINLNGLPKMYVKDPTKLLSNQEVH